MYLTTMLLVDKMLYENVYMFLSEDIHLFCRYLDSNHIRRLLKVHFKDCPLSNSLFLQSNEIAYIEDGTLNHITSITNL